jgi:DNA-binding SARP family transcriptional activator
VQLEEAAGVMEFRLLGPVEVVDSDGLAVALGQRPRTVLALLLLDANEVVSTDRLIDGIWAEATPPASAAGSPRSTSTRCGRRSARTGS